MRRICSIGGVIVASLALVACEGTSLDTARDATQSELSAVQPQYAADRAIGDIHVVGLFYKFMPTGVTVSADHRIFVCFPRWGDNVPFTVAEMHGQTAVAYPDATINQADSAHPAEHFISVQSVVVDPRNRLWVLDSGAVNMDPPISGGAKLVGIDLATNHIFKKIILPPDVALPTTYLNDVRFDLRRGKEGMAFITDSSSSGPSAIIVVDLASGQSWRKLSGDPSVTAQKNFLPIVEGQPLMVCPTAKSNPQYLSVGADGIAIGPDGQRLYYSPLASRQLYSVSIDALADRNMPDAQVAATVQDLGPKGGASDGLESDRDGGVYVTDYEHNAILRRDPATGLYQTVAHDPRMIWPDTMCLARDGYLYFTCNQLDRLPRFHFGQDYRQPPYVLFRINMYTQPVLLK